MSLFSGLVGIIEAGKSGFLPELDKSYKKISLSNELYDVYEATSSNGKVIMAVDKQHNRLAYTEMYSAADKPLFKKIIQYASQPAQSGLPIITRTIEFIYEQSAHNSLDVVTTITTDFNVFKFKEKV